MHTADASALTRLRHPRTGATFPVFKNKFGTTMSRCPKSAKHQLRKKSMNIVIKIGGSNKSSEYLTGLRPRPPSRGVVAG